MAFQTALKFWQDFDVPSLQRVLDEEAAEIAKRQDASDASVKKLVELSREFRKTANEEIRKKVSPLMKAFQSEIDSLTKRGNSAETAFLTLYKKVIEIPDPVSLMEQALAQQQKLTSISDLQVENTKLRETLEEYNKEFAQVKNQEATINKLKTQIKDLESSAVKRAASKADEIESKLMETYSEKEREMKGIMDECKKKMEEAQTRSSVLQSALETTQSELFELKNKQDEISSAKSAEVDILVTDLERANHRVISAEKQLENYKKQVEMNQTQSSNVKTVLDTAELELEVKAKEKEVACLLEDVERLQDNLKQLRDSSTRQITLLEKQLKDNSRALTLCEAKLKTQADYEEIKKELSIMKSVEFSVAHSEMSSRSATMGSSKPLEVLLLEKNRALVNENTGLKTELAELRDHFSSVQSQYKDSLKTIQDQSNLIGQLEADLTRIRPYLPPRSEAEGQDGSQIMAEVIQSIHTEKSSATSGSTESLLSIVTSQRERFKRKNIELESENQQQKQTLNVLQREMDSLRGDNVKLYEKIRFLQTYQGNRATSGHDSTVNQYSSQYEAKLDPFSAFSVKERQRKYMQLSGPDKATLLLGRFILSNKVARMVAFCYTLFLHIIIIMVLAKLINSADSQTVDLYAECAKQFTEHMHAFHPENTIMPHDTGGGGAVTLATGHVTNDALTIIEHG